MVEDMVEFLYTLGSCSYKEAIEEYFPDKASQIELFNVDLPFAGNIGILIQDLKEIIGNVSIRKSHLSSSGVRTSHRTHTLKIPLWDPFLLEEYVYCILLPAFKWLQLFTKNSKEVLTEIVKA
jgi:hypothetical protein